MSVTNLKPKTSWFHDRYFASFHLGQIPYFSASQIAHELGIPVTGDFELASDFIRYQPLVMYDRHFQNEQTPEIYLPLPVIYSWLFHRNREDMNDAGRKWVDAVWEGVQDILDSSPELKERAIELLSEIENQTEEN